jgi:hypothetical protein
MTTPHPTPPHFVLLSALSSECATSAAVWLLDMPSRLSRPLMLFGAPRVRALSHVLTPCTVLKGLPCCEGGRQSRQNEGDRRAPETQLIAPHEPRIHVVESLYPRGKAPRLPAHLKGKKSGEASESADRSADVNLTDTRPMAPPLPPYSSKPCPRPGRSRT